MSGTFRKIWGSGQSRGFKIGAWVVAIGAFAAWNMVDQNKVIKSAPERKTTTKK